MFTGRSKRFEVPKSATGAGLGPNSYNPKDVNHRARTRAPFGSTQRRNIGLTTGEEVGPPPTSYDTTSQPKYIRRAKEEHSVFASRVERFPEPQLVGENLGPEDIPPYQDGGSPSTRHRMRERLKQSARGGRGAAKLMKREVTVPSIPSHDNVYGYKKDTERNVYLPFKPEHIQVARDSVPGPASYAVTDEAYIEKAEMQGGAVDPEAQRRRAELAEVKKQSPQRQRVSSAPMRRNAPRQSLTPASSMRYLEPHHAQSSGSLATAAELERLEGSVTDSAQGLESERDEERAGRQGVPSSPAPQAAHFDQMNASQRQAETDAEIAREREMRRARERQRADGKAVRRRARSVGGHASMPQGRTHTSGHRYAGTGWAKGAPRGQVFQASFTPGPGAYSIDAKPLQRHPVPMSAAFSSGYDRFRGPSDPDGAFRGPGAYTTDTDGIGTKARNEAERRNRLHQYQEGQRARLERYGSMALPIPQHLQMKDRDRLAAPTEGGEVHAAPVHDSGPGPGSYNPEEASTAFKLHTQSRLKFGRNQHRARAGARQRYESLLGPGVVIRPGVSSSHLTLGGGGARPNTQANPGGTMGPPANIPAYNSRMNRGRVGGLGAFDEGTYRGDIALQTSGLPAGAMADHHVDEREAASLPGPGDYNIGLGFADRIKRDAERKRRISGHATAQVSFGGRAARFDGSKQVKEVEALATVGPGSYNLRGEERETQSTRMARLRPSAAFSSDTERFADPSDAPKSRHPLGGLKGTNTPAGGDLREVTRKRPLGGGSTSVSFVKARVAASGGSQRGTFGAGTGRDGFEAAMGAGATSESVGPGAYDVEGSLAAINTHKGLALSRSRRFTDPREAPPVDDLAGPSAGSVRKLLARRRQALPPGPGAYSDIPGGMLKKSFNVTSDDMSAVGALSRGSGAYEL
ncbi:hypothetical protein KIPB_004945 [Kipferlia bialata]|uniref:Uncharacterized protein n=1 Tax=Kipferlia bialata TaxID=797122 RepID=A0A9K3CVA4_9EUKA|nr:hypothetical protein KIPB_004945 [Kipferlia bialata]|eukprot:g4945.t1